jgi:hypothetical protein
MLIVCQDNNIVYDDVHIVFIGCGKPHCYAGYQYEAQTGSWREPVVDTL